MVRTPLLLAASLLALTIAPECSSRISGADKKDDKAFLQGKWQALHVEIGGAVQPDSVTRTCILLIEGDKFRWELEGRLQEEGHFQLDPAKEPREIDTILSLPKAYRGTQCPGIYRLENAGKKLTWCYAANYFGNKFERPKEFKANIKNASLLLVFKKAD